jgi:hypothetical protein
LTLVYMISTMALTLTLIFYLLLQWWIDNSHSNLQLNSNPPVMLLRSMVVPLMLKWIDRNPLNHS